MGDEVFDRMDKGAHMYFCGLKGMMPGITEMLEAVAAEKGLVWEDVLKKWKSRPVARRGLLARRPPAQLFTARRAPVRSRVAQVSLTCHERQRAALSLRSA